MSLEGSVQCPACGARDLRLRYEVAYVYSYILDSDAPGRANGKFFHPYVYDERTQKMADQYVECMVCHEKFPCYLQKPELTLRQLQESLCAAWEKQDKDTNSKV